jgi:hypothetical protein
MGAWMRVGVLVGALLLNLIAIRAVLAKDDLPPKLAFVAELQKAVGADDKAWLVAHLHFPVHYYGARTTLLRSKAQFLKRYATVIGPELKAAVVGQDINSVFENWQGLMIGEGRRNIWVRVFGADLEPKYEIITINDSK